MLRLNDPTELNKFFTWATRSTNHAVQKGRQFVSIVRNYLVYCDAKLLPPCCYRPPTGRCAVVVESLTVVLSWVNKKNCTSCKRHYLPHFKFSAKMRPNASVFKRMAATRRGDDHNDFCEEGWIYAHSLFAVVSLTSVTRKKRPRKVLINAHFFSNKSC